MKLKREDFFSHTRIQKLAGLINKKTLAGFNYLYVKDNKLIKLLKENSDWLDYIGISLKMKPDKTLCIKWDSKSEI
jgi:hypothetical protein